MKHEKVTTVSIDADRRSLKAAVAFAARATARRNTIPILDNVRITAGDEGITVAGTNLDMEASRVAEGSGHGDFTLPAKTLLSLIRVADGDQVAIQSDGEGRVKISSGSITARLRTMPADDFPAFLAPYDDGAAVAFSEGSLTWLLRAVRPAISAEETRYYLNGIFLHHVGGEVRAVATDGHRLALRRLKQDAPDFGNIIPRCAIPLLIEAGAGDTSATFHRQIETGEIETYIDYQKRQQTRAKKVGRFEARFSGDGWTVKIKTIDGQFPDYSRVLPTGDAKASVNIRTGEIRRALKVVGVTKASALALHGSEFGVKAKSSMPDIGEVETAISGDATGEFQFGINPAYLEGFLPFFGSDVRIDFRSGSEPLDFYVAGTEDRFVIMPMRA